MILFYLDLFGTIVFALSGVLLAARLNMDLFGALVLATASAIGGGTVRDLLLSTTPFWMKNDIYLFAILGTCLAAYFGANLLNRIPRRLIAWADAIGLAAFTVIGVIKGHQFGMSPAVCVILGIMTGAGGGVIRDTLANQIPMIFVEKSFYATASFFGGLFMILTLPLLPLVYVMIGGGLITLLLRVGALYFGFGIPYFKNPEEGKPQS